MAYFERLRTPWWWYLAAIAVAVLLGAEFGLAVSGWLVWVPFGVLVPLALLVVWRLSSATIVVTGQTLAIGDRILPLAEVAQPIVLSPTELRRLVGRHSDPLAFSFIRSWVGPGIQLVLTDEPSDAGGDPGLEPRLDQDPESEPPALREPYWLISSRHPDRLLVAVRAGTAAA